MTHSLHCLQEVCALETFLKSVTRRKPISHLAVDWEGSMKGRRRIVEGELFRNHAPNVDLQRSSSRGLRRDRYCKEQGVATDDYVMPNRVASRLQVLGSSPAAFSSELQEPGDLFQEFRFCAPPWLVSRTVPHCASRVRGAATIDVT